MTVNPKPVEAFEATIGIEFGNRDLLRQVFVHRSYLNEHRTFPIEHNERLEFLGDAVLELVVTEHLFRTFPNPEGELTNWRSALVRGEMLSTIAERLNMGEYLYLSRGERQSIGKSRQLILANAFEALIGAIYMEHGYEITQTFLARELLVELDRIREYNLHIDAKSRFQELVQDEHGVTPTYSVLSEIGPDHSKEFTVGIYIGEQLVGQGGGSSKQRAEQHAASDALAQWLRRAGQPTGPQDPSV